MAYVKLNLTNGTVFTAEHVAHIEAGIANAGGDTSRIFEGKTASFYGDSLTEVNNHYTKGYHSWVKDLLGLASYNNYGVSGYKVSDVYNKVNSVTDTADIVFVMCGVNDQNFSVPLGAMGDNTTGTTYGALNLLCALLKEKYPTKPVVFITPHYQTKYPHSSGVTSYEVSKAIREVCEKYAIPVYDNFVLSGIYSTNLSVFTTDNCHWNDVTHEMVGKNLAKFVTDSFRYVYGDTTVSVTGVSLNVSSGTLVEGDRVTLVATVLPSNATNKNVTWKSNNTSVATVSGGVVSAISEGTAVITATTEDGGYTATYSLKVETNNSVSPAPVVTEVTNIRDAEGFHLTLYVAKETLPSINDVVTFGFTLAPLDGFTLTKTNAMGSVYTVDEINNLVAGYTLANGGTITKAPELVNNSDGTYTITQTFDGISDTITRNYWIFPINIPLSVGDKFVISGAYVKVGTQYYDICAIAGAFTEEVLSTL